MIMTLDFESDCPIYLQIRNQVVLGLAKGDLVWGEEMPTVRQLATDAGINPMTVNKAYALLKQEGYLVIDRRRGARISEEGIKRQNFSIDQLEALTLLIAEAKLSGLDDEAFITHVKTIFQQLI